MEYERIVMHEWLEWEKNMNKPLGFLESSSRKMSAKFNQVIPSKVKNLIDKSFKGMIQTALFGVAYLPKREVWIEAPLYIRNKEAEALQSQYKKIASAEGAGTGLGGFKLSLIDFPALLAIKMKFLFELAHVYGFSTAEKSEKHFILNVFHLTYASPESRQTLLDTIKRWPTSEEDENFLPVVDWEALQQQYRDALDFRKILQMVPGFGAIVGAWANYDLMAELGNTAMRCYQYRLWQAEGKVPQLLENSDET